MFLNDFSKNTEMFLQDLYKNTQIFRESPWLSFAVNWQIVRQI